MSSRLNHHFFSPVLYLLILLPALLPGRASAGSLETIDNVQDLMTADAASNWESFRLTAGGAWTALVDKRTGRVGIAEGAGIPWIPGTGNELARADFPRIDLASMDGIARTLMPQVADLLGIDPAHLVINKGRSGQPADYLWFVDYDVVTAAGQPIEGARVVFRVNHGNLIQFGTENMPAPGDKHGDDLDRNDGTATEAGTFTSNGCGVGTWWKTMRAVDDDDGNLANGTPHGGALFAAFNHGIACATDAVTSGDFTISASPATLSVGKGKTGSSTISTTIPSGFNSPVIFSATGLPTGVTVSFSPAYIAAPGAGSSTATVSVAATTATGTYPITITGSTSTSGCGISRTTTAMLAVTEAPGFTIAASPAAISVRKGNAGTSTIATAISSGFNSPIAFWATGQPAGVTVSFSPAYIAAPGAGSSTATFSVATTTPTGTYPITVTGSTSTSGGGITRTTIVTLTVTEAPGFTIAATPAAISVRKGNAGTSTVITAIASGF